MKTNTLILAHRLVAALQKTDPEADLQNALSLTFLSIASAVSQSELKHRLTDLARIQARQVQRTNDLLQSLLDQGISREEIGALLRTASETASVATLEGILNHLRDRPESPL